MPRFRRNNLYQAVGGVDFPGVGGDPVGQLTQMVGELARGQGELAQTMNKVSFAQTVLAKTARLNQETARNADMAAQQGQQQMRTAQMRGR